MFIEMLWAVLDPGQARMKLTGPGLGLDLILMDPGWAGPRIAGPRISLA